MCSNLQPMGRVLFYDHSLGVLVLDLTHTRTHTRTRTRTHVQKTYCVRDLRCGLLPREHVMSVRAAFALSPFRSPVDLDQRLQSISSPASYVLLKRILCSCRIWWHRKGVTILYYLPLSSAWLVSSSRSYVKEAQLLCVRQHNHQTGRAATAATTVWGQQCYLCEERQAMVHSVGVFRPQNSSPLTFFRVKRLGVFFNNFCE